jgi:uncharacterized protein YndB with AHSA1/START domain
MARAWRQLDPVAGPPPRPGQGTAMLTIIVILIAVILIAAVSIVAVQPSAFTVTRTATINAPPAAVFAQIDDFHAWQAWSPWAKLDPAAVLTYDGAPAGVGASYSWNGNKKMGAGRMTISASDKHELVRIDLVFTKPFRATNVVEFTFTQAGDQTIVSWSMNGRNGFIAKAFALFVDFDTLVGGDFEKGLAAMKAVVESGSKAPAAG